MAVPKKRTSKRRKGMRRSHDALKFKANVVECADCGELKLRHHICAACGIYRGRKIVEVEDVDAAEDSEE